jgi:hypothetical protein
MSEPLVTHEHLCQIVRDLPQDYEPWGQQERSSGDCSCGCKWFVELAEPHGMDWGVCTSFKSHRFGLLTFEHQGCVHYEYDEATPAERDEE